MTESPAVVTSNSTNADCSTLSTPIQCSSETEVSLAASELVTITHKMVERNDGQSKLVIGKVFILFHFSDSELV